MKKRAAPRALFFLFLALPVAAAGESGTPTFEACTDFYMYANGGWLAANPIPEGQSRWSPRSVGRAENQRRLQALLEDAARRRDAAPGSSEKLVGDLYASCVDAARPDEASLASLSPLASLLAEIDGARTSADVQRALRRLHAIGVPVGFTAVSAYSYRDPSRTVLNISAGAFGLPRAPGDRDVYKTHVAKLLSLGGDADAVGAADAAGAVVALEARLAEAALDADAAADPAKTDHEATFAQLTEIAPSIDWAAYFDEAGLPRTPVNVAEPGLLRQLDRAMRETPVAVWRAYLRFQLLDAAAPYLSPRFVDESAAKGKARATFCAETTEALLGDEVGELYVKRHFPRADRARVEAMVAALVAAARDDVANVAWMSPETKKRALAKLATYDTQVGAPRRWRDHGGLSLRRDAFFSNVAAARRSNVEQDRRRVGKATNRDLWQLPASSSAAYIDAQLNQIVLPAGFLFAIGYRTDMEDAELYGRIGVGIAHDVTHALDAGGADFDDKGRPARWWNDADRKGFEARAGCVDDTYAAFEVEPGLPLDGKRVESEAIGDLGGVKLGYGALMKTAAARSDAGASARRFFLAWAESRGEALRPETERQLAKSDPHAPGRFRVWGTLVNTPEFQQAFACKAGARMSRPAEKRCAVW